LSTSSRASSATGAPRPGLNLVYAQLNRLIRTTDQDVLYVAGPGHGGPAVVANVYLEGTYSEVYPEVSADAAGLRRLVRQFSTPGGIPSHVSVPIPGSIHEGGTLSVATNDKRRLRE
jgi:xylulose-5-phosphate/fructose-6-phosphate phosphoketolase